MPTETVLVQFVDPPKPGKKNGTIKTDKGEIFSVPPDKLALFQANAEYEVEYKTSNYNDREFKFVQSAKQTKAPTSAAPTGARYGATDDKTAERIFVCGAVNSCLSNPGEAIKFYVDNTNNGVQLVNYWREVWKRTFGGKPSLKDELQDEIPYE